MDAATVLDDLLRRGCRLHAEGDRVIVEGRLTDSDRDAIRSNKPELLRLLTTEAANDGPTFVTPDPDYHRLPWWRVAILADGRRIESDTPSGMTIREWTDYAARHFGPGATVTPLMALHAGPYHVRHADGHTWTMHPTGGLPMSRQAIEAEAQRVTAGVHGEVVAVEEVEQ
jgi:hypothetical protein